MDHNRFKIRYYPIALNLKHRLVVVAGGGAVSERKIKTLLKAGARVRVVSPALTPELKRLVKLRGIIWINKYIRTSDLRAADIIIAATSDPAANKRISQWAKRRKIPVNVVDQPTLSTFISPAVLYSGQVTLAVYTQGRNPALSRDLKNFLEEYWDVFLSYRDRL